jgi:hypothetical protein
MVLIVITRDRCLPFPKGDQDRKKKRAYNQLDMEFTYTTEPQRLTR